MSVQRERRPDGKLVYKVRWRQGGKHRARTFQKLADARAFDRDVNRLRQLGDMALMEKGTITLAEYADDWWTRHAVEHLAYGTQQTYSVQLRNRIVPEFGGWRLRDISAGELERWVGRLRSKGTGDPSILKTLAILQAIFTQAMVDEEVQRNPVELMRKPRQRRTRQPVMLAPVVVERIRRALLNDGRAMDAALVSLLAYAGPRPESEAVAVRFSDVRTRTLRIVATKKDGDERTVRLLAPLANDLREWKVATGRRTGLLFPRPDGGPWAEHDWDNWRDRVFRPACLEAGLPADAERKVTRRGKTSVVQTTSIRPRDLRSSFASLLIWEGQSVVEVARQMGNAPQTCLRAYAGLFEEFDPADRKPAEDVIAAARAEVFGEKYPLSTFVPRSGAAE
jgi:integrase